MTVCTGQRRVTQPYLGALPTILSLGTTLWRHGLSEKSPLRPPLFTAFIGEVGGDIPPFNTVIGMCSEIFRKVQRLASPNNTEALRFTAEAGKSGRRRWLGAVATN
jgi:hypothetical protein